MNNFTYENTKDATQYAIIDNDNAEPCFYKVYNPGSASVLYADDCDWSACCYGKPYFEGVDLFRQHNETRDHWTTNGVTQYAQPQGNEMDISGLPIEYSRGITPFVIGDEFVDLDGRKGKAGLDDLNFWNGSNIIKGRWFVVSFADRPNTGAQPVGDDVVVDSRWRGDSSHITSKASQWNWEREALKTWKPNHAAMLKKYQAEQLELKMAEKLSPSNSAPHPDDIQAWSAKDTHVPHGGVPSDLEVPDPSVDENSDGSKIGNIGNILHNMSCSMVDENEQNEFGGYASFCWELGSKLNQRASTGAGKAETPTFTQADADADAGELPPVGSECIFSWTDCELLNGLEIGDAVKVIAHIDNNGTKIAAFTHMCDNSNGQGEGIFVSIGGPSSFKPIQTAEDRTREVVCGEIIDAGLANCAAVNDVIDLIFNSDKFTITLNSE